MKVQSVGAAAARSARPSSSKQPALRAGRGHQQTQTHTEQTLQMLRWTVQLMMHKRQATQRCVLWLSVHALCMSWWHLLNCICHAVSHACQSRCQSRVAKQQDAMGYSMRWP